jgi:hypothetical protein
MVTKTKNSMPSAWIASSQDRGRKSVKKGRVYLNDDEEFQIELFNPLQNCVLADIKLNGQSISKTGLVLNPGQRFYLDCFVDDKKKFVFKTYDVDDDEESLNAISKNGLLEVFFYNESVVLLNNWQNRFNTNTFYYPYINYHSGSGGYSISHIGSSLGTGVGYGSCTTSISNIVTSSNTSSTNFSSTALFNNVSNTGNVVSRVNEVKGRGLLNKLPPSNSGKSVTTGRVEKGKTSEQKFMSINKDFDKYFISSTVIKILPESTKPLETKDIKRKRDISPVDAVDLIKKLSDLNMSGILTDIEFLAKKEELLSRI